MRSSSKQRALLVRAGSQVCALPLEHVVETMRPAPVSPLSGTPPYVLGVAVVRGKPVPVVDLDAFLGSTAVFTGNRFVVLRTGTRQVVLAVREVVGVGAVADANPDVVPLVSGACDGAVESLATLDDELLITLRLARLVPQAVWDAVAAAESAAVPGTRA